MEAFFAWFKSLFYKPKKLITIIKDAVITPETRNMKLLKKAASQIGVKEIPGRDSNPLVEAYIAAGFVNNKSSLKDNVPWCAAFVAWCLESVYMGSTNSLMARSYEKWGMSSKKHPVPGDIITFFRNGLSSGQGHVGIYLGVVGSRFYVLGGNQSDKVCISVYARSRMTDIRRSSKEFYISDTQEQSLVKLAQKILKANGFIKGGSVV